MKLTHLSTVRDHFGLFEVTVIVNDKREYTYVLGSEYDSDQFNEQLRHHPGQALNWLKKVALERINNDTRTTRHAPAFAASL